MEGVVFKCKFVCRPGCSTLGWDSPSLHCKDLEGELESRAKMPDFSFLGHISHLHCSPMAPTTGSGLEGRGHPDAPSSSSCSTGILAQVCLAAGLGAELGWTCSRHDWASSLTCASTAGWTLSHCSAGDFPALVNLCSSSGKSTADIGAGKWRGVSSTGQPIG